MILLDTNIVSELMKPSGDPRVRAWVDSGEKSGFFIATPVVAELRFGIAVLTPGRKKNALTHACNVLEDDIFAGRILDFDRRAAHIFASLRARRQSLGKPLPVMDGIIAAIASANAMALATRNIGDFADLGIPLIDPFASSLQPN